MNEELMSFVASLLEDTQFKMDPDFGDASPCSRVRLLV